MDTQKLIDDAVENIETSEGEESTEMAFIWLSKASALAQIAIAQELQGIHQELKRANDGRENAQELQEQIDEMREHIGMLQGQSGVLFR